MVVAALTMSNLHHFFRASFYYDLIGLFHEKTPRLIHFHRAQIFEYY